MLKIELEKAVELMVRSIKEYEVDKNNHNKEKVLNLLNELEKEHIFKNI